MTAGDRTEDSRRSALPPPDRCWGKLRHQIPGDRSSPVIAWLPLEDHCADVAACAVALLGRFTPTILNRRLARLGGQEELDPVQVARLGVLAGLHDVGKCNHGFQAKAYPEQRSRWAGHIGEVVPLVTASNDPPTMQSAFLHALGWSVWSDWFEQPETAVAALLALVSHHGRPATSDKALRNLLWGPSRHRDPLISVAGLWIHLVALLPQAARSGRPLPPPSDFTHAFAGLVQLADWLASDDRLFPFDLGTPRWPAALNAATQGVEMIGLDAAAIRAAMRHPPGFSDICPSTPRPMQSAVATLPLPDAIGSLLLIEDETGAGKTEAALLHFARLFQAGLVDGLYFALPTRTAASQIFVRVRETIARLLPEERRPACILAVPGYLCADEAVGRILAPFSVLWPDDDGERHRFWAAEHPKRFLAGTVVVGTIDQVLLSGLTVDHSHLRATCLLRHLLVVDEVHASDTYMTTVLRRVLARHRRAGGHALLLSATLGVEAAGGLLDGVAGCALSEAVQRPYPALSNAGPSLRAVPSLATKPPITLDLRPILDQPEVIAGLALEAAAQGARVLVLRNTVTGALAVQAALEARDDGRRLWRVAAPAGPVPVVHHARFAREDRLHLDTGIESVFGKAADRSCGLVACATQTVQQSLDLDADLLLTDLCPMDVLLQRLGRLHRHRRSDRTSGFTQPRCLVLLPDREPADLLDERGRPRLRQGLGSVYEDLAIVAATWEALLCRPCLHLPQDNRALVEAALHSQNLKPWRERDDRWRRHANTVFGVACQHRCLGGEAAARWDLPFDDPRTRFAGGDLERRITTRLGAGDGLLTLDAIGPFGHRIHALTIPQWMGCDPTAQPDLQAQGGQSLLIHYPARSLVYDRLGLRRQSEEADGDHDDV